MFLKARRATRDWAESAVGLLLLIAGGLAIDRGVNDGALLLVVGGALAVIGLVVLSAPDRRYRTSRTDAHTTIRE